jgi:hypothetical protein
MKSLTLNVCHSKSTLEALVEEMIFNSQVLIALSRKEKISS